MDDFRRQVIYAADTPKHGHTHRCLFSRTLLGPTIQPNTQTPRRDQRHTADINYWRCWAIFHFVTSLTTAVFSSLAPYHRGDLCGENWTGFVSPTVVTCPKMPPPCVAAGWLLASNSYELLRAFMLQMKEAQKRKIIYLGSFVPELVFTVAKVA